MPAPSHALDYIAHLESVIEHIIQVCPALSHVEIDRLLVGWSQSRVGGCHGVYAHIQPLRFEGGAIIITRGRHTYQWPRVVFEGREILYLIHFMLPRFADLPYREKLTTIFHELYHVNPLCNGDVRRFPGRNYAHGSSREAYDARLQPWIEEYLSRPESPDVTAFLKLGFDELRLHHRAVTGRQIRTVRPHRLG